MTQQMSNPYKKNFFCAFYMTKQETKIGFQDLKQTATGANLESGGYLWQRFRYLIGSARFAPNLGRQLHGCSLSY